MQTFCAGRTITGMDTAVIDAAGLQQLVAVLQDSGYRVVGPTVAGSAIVLAELDSADDSARGMGGGRLPWPIPASAPR